MNDKTLFDTAIDVLVEVMTNNGIDPQVRINAVQQLRETLQGGKS